VAERQRPAQRELQNLLRARRERDLPGRDLVSLADDPCDLRPHFLHRDVERLEYPRREALFLAKQPEQDVLGADVVVLERPGLVLCEDDDLASPFSEAFEQVPRLSFPLYNRRWTVEGEAIVADPSVATEWPIWVVLSAESASCTFIGARRELHETWR
jgi:hypothetical protein